MNALKTLCLGMLLLVAALPGRAQIEVTLSYPNLDIFYIGDLDPFAQGGQIDNFEVGFRVEASGDYQVDLFLEYQGGVELLHTHLEIENVQAGTYTYSLSDFRNRSATFGGTISLRTTDFDEGLVDQLSFTGNTLPAGVYTLRIDAMLAGQPFQSSDDFVISAPLSLSLQLPGDGSSVSNAFPSFHWSGRAREYEIKVAEYDPLVHGSFEEAIEGDPMWRTSVGSLDHFNMAPTTATYGDGFGARPLVPGRTYVWTVEAVLATTSGNDALSSPIWSFVYLPDGGTGYDNLDPGYQALLSFLNGFMNGQVGDLMALLEGLSLSGPILLNGVPVDSATLMRIFNDIADGQLNLAGLRLE